MAQKDELREIEDMGNAFVDTHARVGKDIATKLPKLFDTLHDPTADECTRSNALKEIEDCIVSPRTSKNKILHMLTHQRSR